MIALGLVIARSELRRSVLVASVLGGAAAITVVGLAGQPPGPFRGLSAGVRGLGYMGLVLMVAGGLLQVRPAETGMARELFLAGVSHPRRRRAAAAAAVVAMGGGWLLATVLAAICGALVRDGGTLVEPGTGSALGWLAIGLVTAAGLTLVGCACGTLCRSSVGVLACVAVIAGVPLVATLFGSLPPALWLKSVFPTSTVAPMLEPYDDFRGAPAFRWGVPAAWLIGSLAVVAFWRDRAGAPRPAPVVQARGPAGASIASAGALVAATVVLGVVAPARVARAVPWWLQGQWVSDLARDRASGPVAETYLEAVIRRDGRRERKMAAGPPDDVLDPEVRRTVRRAGELRDVRYLYEETSPPGTVLATLGEHDQVDLTLCFARRSGGWRVARVVTDGRC